MGPPGYPGPVPFVQPDEEWPPREWLAAQVPPGGAPPAPDTFPPPEWSAGGELAPPWASPDYQPAGSVQPTGELPLDEPPPAPAPPPFASPEKKKGGAPAPTARPKAVGAPGAAAPADPFVEGTVAIAEQRGQAIDDQAAAQAAEAEFRARRGVEASNMTQLQLRDAERKNEDAKQIGQLRTRALTDEIDALGREKPDARRFWAKASTPEKVAAAIALFLGGMQSAFTGKNAALEAFQQIMDRDFAAQQEELANRRETLGMKRGLLSEELAQGRDAYEAKVKHTLLGYDMAMKGIDAEALKWKSPEMQAKAAQMKAEVQQAALGQLQDFTRYQEDKAFREQQAKQQNALGWARLGEDKRQFNAQIDMKRKAADAELAKLNREQQQMAILDPQGRPMLDGSGQVIMAPDPKIALEERQKQAAGWAYYEELQRYKKATEEMGREFGGVGGIIGSTEARSRAESMHKSLMMKYKTAEHLGALDAGAIKVFNDVVAPPSTWTSSSNPAASADEAARVWKDTKNVEMRQVWRYGGNWVDDYEKEVGFKAGATEGKDNNQGRTLETVIYFDDQVGYNTQGKGRPLDTAEVPAQARRTLTGPGMNTATAEAPRIDAMEWKYRRAQNNNAAAAKRPLPFPEVGTGSVD